MNHLDIARALDNLRPNALWILRDGDPFDIEWRDSKQKQPTNEEILNEIDRFKKEDVLLQYQQLREPEYPKMADFIDAYYWMSKGDDTKMQEYVANVDAVKAKYPKPV